MSESFEQDAPQETPETGGEGGQQEQSQGQDFSALEARMNEFQGQFGDFLDDWRSQQSQGQHEDVEPDDESLTGLDWLEQGDEEIDPAQARQGIEQAIQDAVARGVQEHLQPFQEERHADALADLEEDYPALQDEQVAQPVVAEAARMVEQLTGRPVQSIRDIPPEFIENSFLAMMAREQAARETPAGEHGDQLESGSAGAAAGQADDDPAQAILNAGGRSDSVFG